MSELPLFLLVCVVFGVWVFLVNCFLGIWFDSFSSVIQIAAFFMALALWMAGLFVAMNRSAKAKDD